MPRFLIAFVVPLVSFGMLFWAMSRMKRRQREALIATLIDMKAAGWKREFKRPATED